MVAKISMHSCSEGKSKGQKNKLREGYLFVTRTKTFSCKKVQYIFACLEKDHRESFFSQSMIRSRAFGARLAPVPACVDGMRDPSFQKKRKNEIVRLT